MDTDVRASTAAYLSPYLRAVARHGAEFPSLLWASEQTQAARFAAICRLGKPRGRTILDVGCGRADLLEFCIAHDLAPAHYVGIEAVAELANAAEAKGHHNATIVRADFVERPAAMFVGADLVAISGALNTLAPEQFYATLRCAYDAAAEVLVFNFLCSPVTAAADYLHWYHRDDVLAFARTLSPRVQIVTDYLFGDATAAVPKSG